METAVANKNYPLANRRSRRSQRTERKNRALGGGKCGAVRENARNNQIFFFV